MTFFEKSAQKRLLDRIIQRTISRVGVDDRHLVSFSDKAFFAAMEEANFDIRFVKERRGLENGISEGKIAGILYFRLTRVRFIISSAELLDIDDHRTLQERVIIDIIGSLLHVDFKDPWLSQLAGTKRPGGMRLEFQNLHNELIYVTTKRHYKQESLALFFDTCAYLTHAIDQIRNTPDRLVQAG